MAFVDLTFPRDVAAGVTGGPEGRVDIVPLASGAEERNRRWANFRRQYNAALGVRNADQLAAVLDLFVEVGGQHLSFRLRDWVDFKSCLPSASPSASDQTIGTGDDAQVAFQLTKSYGTLTPYSRTITKPVTGTLLVSLDGVIQPTGWTANYSTGIITFDTPPAAGVVVAAGFEFDVPVRFNVPVLNIDMAFFSETENKGLGTMPAIPLIEVIGE